MSEFIINVVNKHNHKPTKNDVYIGRGSVLGNEYTHLPLNKSKAKFQVADRGTAVKCCEIQIYQQIGDHNKKIIDELNRIINLLKKTGEVNLVCFCKPKLCHGDVIKDILLKVLSGELILKVKK